MLEYRRVYRGWAVFGISVMCSPIGLQLKTLLDDLRRGKFLKSVILNHEAVGKERNLIIFYENINILGTFYRYLPDLTPRAL